MLVWVSVLTHYYDDGEVLECIYDTLNAHGIEIPFPQRDLHIREFNDALAIDGGSMKP